MLIIKSACLKNIIYLPITRLLHRAGLNFIIRELHLSERIIQIYSKQELPDLLKKNSQAIIILDYTLFDFSGIERVDKLTRTISLCPMDLILGRTYYRIYPQHLF